MKRLHKLHQKIFLVLLFYLMAITYTVQALDAGTNDVLDNQVFIPLVMQVSSIPTVFQENVVVFTNQARQDHGCEPLSMDVRLQFAAENHSEDMALNDYFAHDSLDGRTPWDRIHNQGYEFSLAGENIAAGYSSPESVVDGWMRSPGHRANILNCDFVHIGVGYYYLQNDRGEINYNHYWTQVFASP
jgi:uncharacterized protein YkwD